MERLDGKRIIITGGTSGMGEGMTRAFPGLGAKVVFWGRNEAAGAKIAEERGDVRQGRDLGRGFGERRDGEVRRDPRRR